jgi:site-specific DNA-methyltransferase (adenine-specific)
MNDNDKPYTLILGDCLEKMKNIPDCSLDMILCDLPYGTTACKWDAVIPFEPLWAAYRRVCKPNAAIVLTASQPFTSALVMSNVSMFRYQWVWESNRAPNFVFGNKQPLKKHEDICVFYEKQPTYTPQKITNPKGIEKRSLYAPSATVTGLEVSSGAPKKARFGASYEPDKLLPKSVIYFPKEHRPVHPTQKPVALMEYLIRTYTNDDQTVLENTMGSGTTGVACANTGRKFIGIERDPTYFNIASKRISEAFAAQAAKPEVFP